MPESIAIVAAIAYIALMLWAVTRNVEAEWRDAYDAESDPFPPFGYGSTDEGQTAPQNGREAS